MVVMRATCLIFPLGLLLNQAALGISSEFRDAHEDNESRSDGYVVLPPPRSTWSERLGSPLDPLSISDHYCSAEYKKIDRYLIQACGSDEFWPNMEAARRKLSEMIEKEKTVLKKIQVALEQFVQLISARTGNICNRISYMILFRNMKAIGKSDANVTPANRIESIVLNVAKEHAAVCLPRYAQEILPKFLAARNYPLIDDISYCFGGLYERQDSGTKREPREICPGKLVSKASAADLGDSALRYISRISVENVEGKLQLPQLVTETLDEIETSAKPMKAADLIDNYLIEPCKFFVHDLGSSIVRPAEFDMRNAPSSQVSAFLELFRASNYCTALDQMRVCEMLIKQRKSIVKYLAKSLKSRPHLEFID